MQTIDMKSIGIEIGIIENYFLSREKGELAYNKIRQSILDTPDGSVLQLSFPGKHQTNTSFIDETIIRIGEELINGELGNRYLLLKHLNSDSIYDVEAAINRQNLKLAFLLIERDYTEWKVIGNLEPSLHETLDFLARSKSLTAAEVSDTFDLAINTASNRLKRLFNLRLVRREHEITEKGLQYIYHFLVSENNDEHE